MFAVIRRGNYLFTYLFCLLFLHIYLAFSSTELLVTKNAYNRAQCIHVLEL